MSPKTLLFVMKDRPGGRDGFRQAVGIASGQGARVWLLVIGWRREVGERESLMRAAAFADEFWAWFVLQAEVAGVTLEIQDGFSDAVAAVQAAGATV